MPAGYSKTPLAKKLGIKSGYKIYLKNHPTYYWKLFDSLPDEIEELSNPENESVDFIHLFCNSKKELFDNAQYCKSILKKDGTFWVSWPKGSSNITTDLKREPIRDHLLEIGLVDTKVAAIDEDWSGLKFMYRIKDR